MLLERLKIQTTADVLRHWAPSSRASRASGIGLTLGVGIMLVVSPALARADGLVAVQTLQRDMFFFLGAVACLPAILLVSACLFRVGTTVLLKRWSPMFAANLPTIPRNWRASRAFVNVPALPTGPKAYHVSLPDLNTTPIGSAAMHGREQEMSPERVALELERALRAAS